MRWSALGLIITGGVAGVVACGLDVIGSAASDGTPSASDASAEPQGNIDPAGDAAVSIDAGGLPDEEPKLPDAGVVDAGPCGSPSFAENFVPDNPFTRWTTYGGVERRVSGTRAHAQLIADDATGVAAGLFWIPQMKAKTFKASFEYRAERPSGGGSIGDGITFTWLTSLNGALGIGAVTGQGLGLQPNTAGHSFALDAFQNSNTNDGNAPFFTVLRLDPTKGAPGTYDWHVRKSPQYDNSVYDQWHTVTVTVVTGSISVTIAGQTLFSSAPIDTSANIVAIGFTAGTGGARPIGFYVDTVQIDLTDASCN